MGVCVCVCERERVCACNVRVRAQPTLYRSSEYCATARTLSRAICRRSLFRPPPSAPPPRTPPPKPVVDVTPDLSERCVGNGLVTSPPSPSSARRTAATMAATSPSSSSLFALRAAAAAAALVAPGANALLPAPRFRKCRAAAAPVAAAAWLFSCATVFLPVVAMNERTAACEWRWRRRMRRVIVSVGSGRGAVEPTGVSGGQCG